MCPVDGWGLGNFSNLLGCIIAYEVPCWATHTDSQKRQSATDFCRQAGSQNLAYFRIKILPNPHHFPTAAAFLPSNAKWRLAGHIEPVGESTIKNTPHSFNFDRQLQQQQQKHQPHTSAHENLKPRTVEHRGNFCCAGSPSKWIEFDRFDVITLSLIDATRLSKFKINFLPPIRWLKSSNPGCCHNVCYGGGGGRTGGSAHRVRSIRGYVWHWIFLVQNVLSGLNYLKLEQK